MVYSIAKDGAVHIYLYDYKGSTTAIVDNSGTVLNAYTYSAYGKVVGSFENVENAYKYLGKYGVITDSDSHIYVRARYYSPDLNRWTQLDALRGDIANPFSLNRYILNDGDGVNYVDISGFERGKVGWTFSDVGHLILDGAGLVPVVGEAFDGVNGIMRYPLL